MHEVRRQPHAVEAVTYVQGDLCTQPAAAADGHLCTQARQAGTLDAQVFSLQARRALFQSLDLIPPEYAKTASSAAAQAAAKVRVTPAALCSSHSSLWQVGTSSCQCNVACWWHAF
jgi:hypothetical protein